jgi:hypothetical protein
VTVHSFRSGRTGRRSEVDRHRSGQEPWPRVVCEMMSQVREIMTWDMLGEATRALSQMVADDGYEPDMILGIARGGLLPAGAMGYALSVKNVSSMSRASFPRHPTSSTCRTARSWWSTMSPTPATR